jgi:predicted nucleic acid-binding protein
VARLTVERNGALSIQVLAEFYAVATRKGYLSQEDAGQVASDFEAWNIHCPVHQDLIRSSQLHRRHGVSWWDALVLNSAIELGCETLWTEDFAHGRQFGPVTARNPFAESASA